MLPVCNHAQSLGRFYRHTPNIFFSRVDNILYTISRNLDIDNAIFQVFSLCAYIVKCLIHQACGAGCCVTDAAADIYPKFIEIMLGLLFIGANEIAI